MFGPLMKRASQKLGRGQRISFRSLRKIAILLLLAALLVTFLVLSIKSHLRKLQDKIEGDRPHVHSHKSKLSNKIISLEADAPFVVGCRVPDVNGPRANASFVMLARNSELDDVVSSMKSMERHFNQWFNYPWVFLNDVEFDDTFKSTVAKHTKAKVEFGVVPQEQWEFPSDIDKDEFEEAIESQGDRTIMYGQMASYHKMCRFYSGHFYSHPLVTRNKWYWRVEPDVKFFCDLTYDPFIEMEMRNKKYGFTVTIEELYYTVPSLFRHTKAFIKKNNIKVASAWDILVTKYLKPSGPDAERFRFMEKKSDIAKAVQQNKVLQRFLGLNVDDSRLQKIQEFKHMPDVFEQAYQKPPLFEDRYDDEEYNLCHFWTNFEIAQTDIFTSQTYQDYFQYLEKSGGFYKERWGDAPVHSLAVAMLLNKEELHYFRDIGYKHTTLGHCPNNAPDNQLPYKSAGYEEEEKPWYMTFMDEPDRPVKNGVGCRCRCPYKHRELEDHNNKCMRRFIQVMADDYKDDHEIALRPLEDAAEREIVRHLRSGDDLEEFSP